MSSLCCICFFFFFFKQKTAYEMRISDWSSDVCSSDLEIDAAAMQRVLEALNALRMNDPDRLGDWFGRFITLYRSAGHAMPADESRSRIEIEWDLQQGHVLHRHPWTRMAWRRAGKGARLYAGGETQDRNSAG